ncbi:MAG: phosphatase PAP2 family protein [Candidatus Aenigmatarchaeota archaeon]|nr:MAG: phosphatase PAP2 family protein [Candidatus Aenigmarchaeota archaeon]
MNVLDISLFLSVWAPWFAVLLATPLIMHTKNYRRAVLYVALLFAVLAAVAAVKTLTAIPRPDGALIPELGSSFPSGHAALAFVPLGFYWSLVRWPHRIALFLFGALVAYSRLVLNVHYPIDVVAGGLIGFAVPYAVMRNERTVLRLVHRIVKER